MENKIVFLKEFKEKYNYQPRTYEELQKLLFQKCIFKEYDLNDIDVSLLDKIGDFGEYFKQKEFYVDEWDVSKVKDFSNCFFECFKFNSDLSKWDVSSGIKMSGFFTFCRSFNNNILNFDISNALEVSHFFYGCFKFNKPLHNFKFNTKVFSLSSFFQDCFYFNQDISMWDVSNVLNFDYMFLNCENFLQDISSWNVSKAKSWNKIFQNSLIMDINYINMIPPKFKLWDLQKF